MNEVRADSLFPSGGAANLIGLLSRKSKVSILVAAMLSIRLEVDCVQDLTFWKPHGHMSIAQYAMPVMLLTPWICCLWGIWKARQIVTNHKIESDIGRIVEYIAIITLYSYLLLFEWGGFILALPKGK